MPAYNEADGICETLFELDDAFLANNLSATLYLQDDCSTDETISVIEAIRSKLSLNLEISRNFSNLRHGPTTIRAYERACAGNHDFVVQLDSDGQFVSSEVIWIIEELLKGADVVIGVRESRQDPWFRRLLTRSLVPLVWFMFHIRLPDANSPVRGYRTDKLKEMLRKMPEDVMTPNILLSILAVKQSLEVSHVSISNRVRRGKSAQGTMWGGSLFTSVLIPRSLITFCFQSFHQLLHFRRNN